MLLVEPAVELSTLAGDAVLTGAVRLAADQVWERELGGDVGDHLRRKNGSGT
ncbi:hypothetical protein OHA79_48410 (plasmid) [Streptomyces sp. NBC_00841]|uniref:hypothetical protein n=1 Tax=unclassified Streptomyces TaxID=2593676 RepID=UPI002256F36C|nr:MULTISPECIES: hypothetical protein [unclassified Streptomyces]MCX4538835.1 hypothetical protein [Streptomyces sp. NBC_01669]WSA05370.1 hypothetical protein OHA79_48410 [Streptomyces sp. NBC_00841]